MKPASKDEINLALLRLQGGDMDALSTLYDLTSKPLFALCYSYLENQHDAEDALSESYLKIVREIGRFHGKSGFNWMYTVTKNICLNMKKKRQREIPVDLQDEQTVNMLEASQIDQAPPDPDNSMITLARKTLREHEFTVVILHAVGGHRFGEIARRLGKPEPTVRWQYNNALKKLQKAYRRSES